MKKLKIAFHTLGCKTNSYETQAIIEQFMEKGYEIVDFEEKADVYVVNTCSVTNTAAQKSRQMLHKAAKQNDRAIIVATGCIAQEAKEELLKDADIVVGNNEKIHISEMVDNIFSMYQSVNCQKKNDWHEPYGQLSIADDKTETVAVDGRTTLNVLVDDLSRCDVYEEQSITNQGDHVRAYVKIQDGCNRFCSYCIIPFLRGRSRSRDFREIIAETKTLAANGYKEIVLTGIDISSFEIPGCRRDSLLMLLVELNKIEGLERIRLGSLEVGIVTEEFVTGISGLNKLCPQFHLSLQSGSDSVLKRMNRHYTADEYKAAVNCLRKYFENPAITTDIIVGFPGETEEEFYETVEFAEKIRFAKIHVFPYSRRKGTAADRMEGQLTKAEKDTRAGILLKLTEILEEEYRQSFSGKKVKILLEERISKDGQEMLTGYSPEYVKYSVDEGKINEIVSITAK